MPYERDLDTDMMEYGYLHHCFQAHSYTYA